MTNIETKEQDYVIVIGGGNIDIGGTPYQKPIDADSNHGDITISFGGVGRNIAHDLCKLGVNIKLVIAVGGDSLGQDMLNNCEELGMDITYVLRVPEESSSMYLYVNDEKGDMQISVDHMDICKHITPEYIDSIKDVINGASAVVVDGNISKETFKHILEISEVPVYDDPVSTDFAVQIKDDMKGLDMLKPNRLEAEYITGMTIRTEADFKAAAKAILTLGVHKVFISMGSDGMLAAERTIKPDGYYIDEIYKIDSIPTEVVSTTGAGDSATAAIIWAYTSLDKYMDLSKEEDSILALAGKAANATASITIGSVSAINPELSAEAVLEKIRKNNMKKTCI